MDARLFEFDQPVQGGFFQKLFRQTKIIFKYAQLSRDGIPYSTTEGSFYLPTAIIFYDVDDANFPSEFYFIAKIGQQLELRQCDAGLGVKWFQIPDLHHAVTDSKVIQKIGDSFTQLKEKVIQQFKDRPIPTPIQTAQEDEESPDLNEEQKQAYRELAEICLKNHPRKNIALAQIEQLKQEDDDFFSTIGQLRDDLFKENIRLFVSMDWKQEVSDLEWHLSKILKDNWQLDIELPNAMQFGENAIVSDDEVFATYDTVLHSQGLKIGYLDIDSDSYVFMVHPIQATEAVKKNIEIIGYQYQ